MWRADRAFELSLSHPPHAWALGSARPARTLCRYEYSATDAINERAALRAMPPVLRGYVRTGCMIGNGAVIDRQFQTVDVFVLMPLAVSKDRYMARYGQNA